MKRYNLSGIYIFDQFPGENRRAPTCIEDCSKDTRKKWISTLDNEALMDVIEHLCDVLHSIGEELDNNNLLELNEE